MGINSTRHYMLNYFCPREKADTILIWETVSLAVDSYSHKKLQTLDRYQCSHLTLGEIVNKSVNQSVSFNQLYVPHKI